MEVLLAGKKVRFTQREVDIILCLVQGRSLKKTAHLLGISPRTAEGYFRNIMVKVDCHSRDHFIDILESSPDFLTFKRGHNAFIEGPIHEILSQPETNDSLSFVKAQTSLEKRRGFAFFRARPFLRLSIVIFGICIGFGALYCNPFFSLSHRDFSKFSFRSEIVLPHAGALLERLPLLEKIDRIFKKSKGIKIVSLLGNGGSGKTTLARLYANIQKRSVVWEINAESKRSLKSSFEKLAEALSLCQTPKDQLFLKEIKEIQNSLEREEKILNFVKSHLYRIQNWLLIYDNAEKFSDLKDYIPYDPKVWGEGRVLVTTQNPVMGNHVCLKESHVIKLQELTSQEKLDLFTKIVYAGLGQKEIKMRQKDAQALLKKVPSFPLDVSTAAHFIKITKIPYKDYGKLMERAGLKLSAEQEKILQDVGTYTKTRYQVLSLSLDALLRDFPEFQDILLLTRVMD